LFIHIAQAGFFSRCFALVVLIRQILPSFLKSPEKYASLDFISTANVRQRIKLSSLFANIKRRDKPNDDSPAAYNLTIQHQKQKA